MKKRPAKRTTARTSTGRSSGARISPKLFDFLRELERNNNREWFERNKNRYLSDVRDPLLRFISDFAPRLRGISPRFVADPRPNGGSMFRIYRDVRFSKDKRPYKTAATAQFRHERGKDVHAPGFYLHLGVDAVYMGAGLWHPDTGSLARIRAAIVEDPGAWKRLKAAKAFREHLELGGESLKRPPRGFDPDHPLIEDLKRKDFVTFSGLDERTACSSDFADRYAALCRSGGPFVRFLTQAVGLDW